jgi:hypothetical protein
MPAPGLNNQNNNGQQPSYGQNNYNPSAQSPNNQYGIGYYQIT